jgi:hypothetical protein
MNLKGLFTLAILSLLALFPSCIQDEPLNAEADILKCHIHDSIMKADPQISNDKITILTKKSTDVTKLAPEFDLTPGATITPASGTVRDFTTSQIYTVLSQDRKWSKDYSVAFNMFELPVEYNFEHAKLVTQGKKSYYEVYEFLNGSELNIWASGNPAFSTLAADRPANEYPTAISDNGKEGKGLRLQTLSTGDLGAMVNMPIAAGNLFLGTFNSIIAMQKPLEATQFGLPIESEPTHLEGYYKFTSGKVFTDGSGKVVPNKTDIADIYAVFYESTPAQPTLDGANILTSSTIISIARIENPGEPSEYTFFSIPFKVKPGKIVDADKLKNNRYNLAVVFSSSREGAYFSGSVGSTLYVDQVKVITK